jgi:hypothetical protein
MPPLARRISLGLIARVVHDDRESVGAQALGGRPTDAARATGHDRHAAGRVGHGLAPLGDKSVHEQLRQVPESGKYRHCPAWVWACARSGLLLAAVATNVAESEGPARPLV